MGWLLALCLWIKWTQQEGKGLCFSQELQRSEEDQPEDQGLADSSNEIVHSSEGLGFRGFFVGCEEFVVPLEVSAVENESKGDGNISPGVEPFQTFLFSVENLF